MGETKAEKKSNKNNKLFKKIISNGSGGEWNSHRYLGDIYTLVYYYFFFFYERQI